MKSFLTMGVLLAVGLAAVADEGKKEELSATKLLGGGVAKAKQNHKPVFLLFGSPN